MPDDGFRLHRHVLRQHAALGALDLAPRQVRRASTPASAAAATRRDTLTWEFSSDVCKHCENAGCLEACPTGSIVRTEFGGVFVQPDICNGCGYCVVACPFGVDRPPADDDGRAFKCTFCYDRQIDGLEPACAKACPTESILFGALDELRRARRRTHRDFCTPRAALTCRCTTRATRRVNGIHAFFLVPGDAARFGLPTAPEAPTIYLRGAWTSALATAAALLASVLIAFSMWQ